ncbi:MAG: bifunctional nuclease family protein [bacterium]|nr:bifunctional nuclease family protein [bacterium]
MHNPLAVCLLSLGLALVACSFPAPDDSAVALVEVVSVEMDPENDTPILLLREREGLRRELPIWIGQFEAISIALATEGIPAPRPNTHDLIKRLMDSMQGSLSRVVVTELRGSTYYAVIELLVGGETVEVDCRPSDAIAVAIRTDTPIYASDAVLREIDRIPNPEESLDVDWRREIDAIPSARSRARDCCDLPTL